MTEITATVKALSKYKQKFNSTGFLLVKDGKEVWVDIPGEHDYKVYKGHQVTVKATQNSKGYWGGTLVHPQAQSGGDPFSQPTKQSAASPQARPKGEDETKLRSMSLAYAKDLVAANVVNIDDIYRQADEFLAYIENRKVAVAEPQVQSNPDYEDGGQPEDDDIPF